MQALIVKLKCAAYGYYHPHDIHICCGLCDKYIFDIEGDVNKFIKKITENKVSSFKSIEPDLEEIFLSFYKKRGKGVK